MNILVINCGSSSLKYQLIDIEDETVIAKGNVERIGIEDSSIKHTVSGQDEIIIQKNIKDHKQAVHEMLNMLTDERYGVIKSLEEISAVGHRTVHGGERFSGAVKIDEKVLETMKECSELAPLHNPPNIIGIEVCKQLMPEVPMVGIFDTAFHQTIPEKAYLYGIPYETYQKYKIRKYGFHGTSHKYVAQKAAEMVGMPLESLKIITCHLGNGSSITAIKDGKSIDTSMGFTPLEGVLMGTRSGDLDPAVITFLMKKENLTVQQIDNLLNKKSGVLGISGVSSDFRDLEIKAKDGNKRAKLAIDIFVYRVKKYIGAYTAAMDGVDIVVFTGGIGENSPTIRKDICNGMNYLGINIDMDKNQKAIGQKAVISSQSSKVKLIVMPTNEELMIALETKRVV
ncbi:MAG: acetate kinase [Clostridia bacterium]|nr:acetate kinase [Clostridia bacterium]